MRLALTLTVALVFSTIFAASAHADGVAQLSAGGSHTCAVMPDGGVKCWGSGFFGQLGNGSTANRNIPTDVLGLGTPAIAVSAGGFHTCAIVAGGAVKCWGKGLNGQLGDGTSTAIRTLPVDVIGLGEAVVQISAGDFHTCAVTASGGVKCWGANTSRQLGHGLASSSTVPVNVGGAIPLTGATAVDAGGEHTCAIVAGFVKCWGRNLNGQLGIGFFTSSNQSLPLDIPNFGASALALGTIHSCATGVGISCWGGNPHGQVGDGTTINRNSPVAVASGASAVAAGDQFTCSASGSVNCWGSNASGQLGNGTTTDSSLPVSVPGLIGVTQISAGFNHACVVVARGGVKCWGENIAGQLGDGTNALRMLPVDVFGLEGTVNPDRDDDGIDDDVDMAPDTPSNEFSDVASGGKTTGSFIVPLATGVTLNISDAPGPDGVRIQIAGAMALGHHVVFQLQGPATMYDLPVGTYVLSDPDFASTVAVDSGGPAAAHIPFGTGVDVSVDAGETATITENQNAAGTVIGFTALAVRGDITVGDQQLPQGEELVVADTTPPVFSGVPSDIVVEATSLAGANVDYLAPTAVDDLDGTVAVLCAPTSIFPLGTTTVTCSASDSAGNTAHAYFSVTVVDTIRPVLNLPGAIIVNATAPGGAIVTYSVTASDNLGGPVTVNCAPPSGTLFPVGTTQVACAAVDHSGNQSDGTFDVTVRGAVDLIVDLIELVRRAQLPPAQETLLTSALQTLLGDPHNVVRVCEGLQLFIALVQRQAGRLIPRDRAALLIASATQIRGALGC